MSDNEESTNLPNYVNKTGGDTEVTRRASFWSYLRSLTTITDKNTIVITKDEDNLDAIKPELNTDTPIVTLGTDESISEKNAGIGLTTPNTASDLNLEATETVPEYTFTDLIPPERVVHELNSYDSNPVGFINEEQEAPDAGLGLSVQQTIAQDVTVPAEVKLPVKPHPEVPTDVVLDSATGHQAPPGDTARVEITVTNNSAEDATNVPLTITLEGNGNIVEATTVDITSGETTTISTSVTIPDSATVGRTLTGAVSSTAANSDVGYTIDVIETQDDITVVDDSARDVTGQPGATVPVTATVENTANEDRTINTLNYEPLATNQTQNPPASGTTVTDVTIRANSTEELPTIPIYLDDSAEFGSTFEYTIQSPQIDGVAQGTITVGREYLETNITLESDDNTYVENTDVIQWNVDATNTGGVQTKQQLTIDFEDEELGDTTTNERKINYPGSETFSGEVDLAGTGVYGDLTFTSTPDVGSQSTVDLTILKEPEFIIDSISTNTDGTIVAGDTLKITPTIKNIGDIKEEQAVSLTWDVNGQTIEKEIEISAGDTATPKFILSETDVSGGTSEITITTEDDTKTKEITVLEPAYFTTSITVQPEQITAGDTITADIDIKNTGDIKGTQDITINSSLLSETERRNIILNPEESTTIELNINTSPNDVREDHTISAASENTTASREFAVLKPAQFDVEFNNDPTEVVAGNAISVTATVENKGGVKDTQTIRLDTDNADLASDTEPLTLNSDQTEPVDFTIPTDVGEHSETTLTLSSDDDTADTSVAILKPALFTVTVNVVESDISVAAGEDIKINTTVTNTGETDATKPITLDAGGLGQKSQSLRLLSGESDTITQTIATTTEDIGEYTATITSPDTDRSTNAEGTINITVKEPAFFEVTELTPPTEVSTGDTINVDYTVKNTGGGNGTQEIKLLINNSVADLESKEISAGSTGSGTLKYDTSASDAGTVFVEVVTDNDSATATIPVTYTLTFDNCNTTGMDGPTSCTYDSAFAEIGTEPTVSDGYQYWTVPHTGTYKITAYGAAGGGDEGGQGAVVGGKIALEQGEELAILVGQKGGVNGPDTGGGGGTFVVDSNNSPVADGDNKPLFVAGGGGGSQFRDNNTTEANLGTSGKNANDVDDSVAPGTDGDGGYNETQEYYNQRISHGAGFVGNSNPDTPDEYLNPAAQSFINGGTGGFATYNTSATAEGGFGGGGSGSRHDSIGDFDNAYYASGGGGGYSGGAAAYGDYDRYEDYAGGGGGSFITVDAASAFTSTGEFTTTGNEPHETYSGTVNAINERNSGHGKVTVELVEYQTGFEVTGLNAPDEVKTGDTINVGYTVINTSSGSDTQDIELLVNDTVKDSDNNTSIPSGDSVSDTLSYQADSSDVGEITVEIATSDSLVGETVTVEYPGLSQPDNLTADVSINNQ